MKNVTIISYPGGHDSSLLSLTESRSNYMLPFGGRFRVVDFTIRNSVASKTKRTLLFTDRSDHLNEYLSHYKNRTGPHTIRVIPESASTSLDAIYKVLAGVSSKLFIIYNGDTPSIINFDQIINRCNTIKPRSTLFLLKGKRKAAMAYKLLVITQKDLLRIIKQAIKDKHQPPNIFEMVFNAMINRGVQKSTFDAHYWPFKNIPEYYNSTLSFAKNRNVINSLFNEKIIMSYIPGDAPAHIGTSGSAKNSFISDSCLIEGSVENSIVYPGVEIGERSVIKDSIILPHVRIGCGVTITRSILDERTDFDPDDTYYNIENACKIGSRHSAIKNTDYPNQLFSSITLVGKNTRITHEARIGGGCYIESGLGDDYFASKKFIYDGQSAVSPVYSE